MSEVTPNTHEEPTPWVGSSQNLGLEGPRMFRYLAHLEPIHPSIENGASSAPS